jgi:hypothetical protein
MKNTAKQSLLVVFAMIQKILRTYPQLIDQVLLIEITEQRNVAQIHLCSAFILATSLADIGVHFSNKFNLSRKTNIASPTSSTSFTVVLGLPAHHMFDTYRYFAIVGDTSFHKCIVF